MSPRKLTDSDKQAIITLYRTSSETTSTLAERYKVSSSTISRFLKSNLPESEYESLIQEKRLSRTAGASVEKKDSTTTEAKLIKALSTPEDVSAKPSSPAPKLVLSSKKPLKLFESVEDTEEEDEDDTETDVKALEELLGEDLGDLNDDDDDLEDEEDWDEEEDTSDSASHIDIHVLPLSEASLPRPCYLVIDRAAELITRPLRDFGDLGEIAPEEVQQKTLPVFDNHRVARRFSNRSQRVIKVPDGRLLQKTCSHLQEKGITRLLIDGQVYAL